MESESMSGGWRKSSLCEGGACIEVTAAAGVLVRDTADRSGYWLAVTPEAWATFTTALKGGAA